MKYGFGVDLGGTTVKLAYFDETGNLLHKWEILTRTQDGGKYILPDIAQAVNAYIQKENIAKSDLLGIGIGVPGPVNHQGVVNKCINLGWGVFNIAQELSQLTGLPVKAGNDATVAALGECWKGGGQGFSNMVFVTLGTGVGGGIVIEGQALHGAHGSGAEIGHMVINREETLPCNCGNFGCVEQYCSATGIVRMAKEALQEGTSSLSGIENLTCKDVFDAGKAGDALALQVLNRFYNCLGEAVANICSVVNPEAVVIGGGVSRAGQMILDGIREPFLRHVFHAARNVTFALATLGNDAGAYGAFRLII